MACSQFPSLDTVSGILNIIETFVIQYSAGLFGSTHGMELTHESRLNLENSLEVVMVLRLQNELVGMLPGGAIDVN